MCVDVLPVNRDTEGMCAHVPSFAATASSCRSAAVRLALLQKLLLSWQPDQLHLQKVLDLIVPLLVGNQQQLLTTAEAAALQETTGEHDTNACSAAADTCHKPWCPCNVVCMLPLHDSCSIGIAEFQHSLVRVMF
jgi:hypothetical protein